MSNLIDLERYKNRKELSKTATKEVVEIFCKLEDVNDINGLCNELLIFPQAVLGEFVTKKFETLSQYDKDSLLSFIKTNLPHKYGHMFRVFTSLIKLGNSDVAMNLLFANMDKYFIGKINKQIFIGLEKTIKECGYKQFVFKLNEDQSREKSVLASFLKNFAEYSKKEIANALMIEFYEINNMKILEIEEVVADAGNKESDSFDVKQILIDIAQKYDRLQKELEEAKDANFALKDKVEKTCSQLDNYKDEIGKLIENNKKEELLKSECENTVKQLKKDKIELTTEMTEMRLRLNLISTGYDVAGQHEIDEFKGKLAKKLASAYSKYLEIKDKEQDLSYYEVLLLILDETFKKLKKSGIDL